MDINDEVVADVLRQSRMLWVEGEAIAEAADRIERGEGPFTPKEHFKVDRTKTSAVGGVRVIYTDELAPGHTVGTYVEAATAKTLDTKTRMASRETKYPHTQWAASARRADGNWVVLHGLPASYVSEIKRGRHGYKPAGAFDARSREGVVEIKWLGPDGRATLRKKIDHEAVRARVAAADGEWVRVDEYPQSYQTYVKYGRFGYEPGKYETKVEDGAVWLRSF